MNQETKTESQSTMSCSDVFEFVKAASVPFTLQPRTSVKCPLCSPCHQLCILLPLKHSWQRYASVKDIQSGLCQMGHLSSCQCTRWHYPSEHTVSWLQLINTQTKTTHECNTQVIMERRPHDLPLWASRQNKGKTLNKRPGELY